jgi:hypothetical protein
MHIEIALEAKSFDRSLCPDGILAAFGERPNLFLLGIRRKVPQIELRNVVVVTWGVHDDKRDSSTAKAATVERRWCAEVSNIPYPDTTILNLCKKTEAILFGGHGHGRDLWHAKDER